jgi:thiamine kinase-like enzyme
MADLSLVYSEPSLQHVLREHLALLVKGTSTERVCHIDLNPWNLLLDGNNAWVTLDWETVARAPPLFDLVGLCDGYSLTRNFSQAHSTNLSQSCLATYNELMKTSYPPTELAAARTLFHWREYAWAAARLAQGRLRSTVLDDVLQQRRVYAKKLNEQAAALGVQLVLS